MHSDADFTIDGHDIHTVSLPFLTRDLPLTFHNLASVIGVYGSDSVGPTSRLRPQQI